MDTTTLDSNVDSSRNYRDFLADILASEPICRQLYELQQVYGQPTRIQVNWHCAGRALAMDRCATGTGDRLSSQTILNGVTAWRGTGWPRGGKRKLVKHVWQQWADGESSVTVLPMKL
jgi:hypothetical protein